MFTWQNLPYQRRRWLARLNLWLADGLVCGNQKSYEVHQQISDIQKTVIPMNGLDPNYFSPSLREQKKETTFIFIGAIGYRKGLAVLLDSMSKLQITNYKLLIVGSGEFKEELEQIINHTSKIKNHVTLIPWATHDEVVALLQKAEVFVYPSIAYRGWEEQFGYAMAEASLMELPIVSTKSGSIEEVVRDGETGLLVPPGDVQALSQAMQRLAANPDERQRMGQAGRRYISDFFNHQVIAKKYQEFFNRFVK